ncbi:hypothetical protein ACFP2T_06055 [Plantactinospora solaniradicis]|uniref:Uncharacterized protein n=1 Tax=Plantactinospora solaniradicis TaxID=1723736 RepID=A0ABW1K2V8_9ACTN
MGSGDAAGTHRRSPAGLFGDVEALARTRGLGPVVDAWGADLDLLR